MYDLTAMGELLIDFTQLSTDGEGYPTLAAHPGGAPGNFLAALCRYGSSAAFLGKVGDDAFGRLLVDTLARAGIETLEVLFPLSCRRKRSIRQGFLMEFWIIVFFRSFPQAFRLRIRQAASIPITS